VSADMPSGSSCMVSPVQLIKLISDNTGMGTVASFPLVTVINFKGEVLYLSQGYRIGISDDLIKLLH